MCLTAKQLKRQDYVDKKIYQLMHDLAPESAPIEWDIRLISHIRDSVEDVLVSELKLTNEMDFYPYLKN